MNEVSWIYRFRNFERALTRLKAGLEQKELDQLQKEGLIQRFEFTLELAWKTLKDKLEYDGLQLDPISPRNIIRVAFEAKFITDANLWFNMLKDRNLSSHLYEAQIVDTILANLRTNYLTCPTDLYLTLKKNADF